MNVLANFVKYFKKYDSKKVTVVQVARISTEGRMWPASICLVYEYKYVSVKIIKNKIELAM